MKEKEIKDYCNEVVADLGEWVKLAKMKGEQKGFSKVEITKVLRTVFSIMGKGCEKALESE